MYKMVQKIGRFRCKSSPDVKFCSRCDVLGNCIEKITSSHLMCVYSSNLQVELCLRLNRCILLETLSKSHLHQPFSKPCWVLWKYWQNISWFVSLSLSNTFFPITTLLPFILRCGTHTVSPCGPWVWWVGWSLSGPWWRMGRLCVSTPAGAPIALSPSTWLVLQCPWGR